MRFSCIWQRVARSRSSSLGGMSRQREMCIRDSTISVPRVKHADDIDPDEFDNGIDDDTFLKICACIRVAVPYTGMIMSTRENQSVRERALHLGISQVSGGSRTSVGGYTEEERPHDTEQFDVSDNRTLDEVVAWLMELGYIPSFCTACYREGRTGDRFMSLCKDVYKRQSWPRNTGFFT